jgi:hypothetical protein
MAARLELASINRQAASSYYSAPASTKLSSFTVADFALLASQAHPSSCLCLLSRHLLLPLTSQFASEDYLVYLSISGSPATLFPSKLTASHSHLRATGTSKEHCPPDPLIAQLFSHLLASLQNPQDVSLEVSYPIDLAFRCQGHFYQLASIIFGVISLHHLP